MFPNREPKTISDPEVLTPWQKERAEEIQARLSYLIQKGKINEKNLQGRIIDLGTGSGAGLVALRALGATKAVGVENGSGLRRGLEKIAEIPISPFEAFSPSDSLLQQEKIFEMSNEQFLEIVKEGEWGISLVTCFWVSYDLAIKQIEEVLIPGGQVIITSTKDNSRLKELARKTSLESQVLEIPEEKILSWVNDRFIFIGTKGR